MKYKEFIKIVELSLQGNKEDLIREVRKIASDSSNNNKYSLYREINNLLKKYDHIEFKKSSLLKQEPDITNVYNNNVFFDDIENIWLPKKIKYRVDSFINLQKHFLNSGIKKGRLNKLLLYGPPGTGKTTLGFYIAKELNKSINYVKVSDVISSKFGETMKNISSIFKENKEEIIFIDEFDAFAKSRVDTNDIGELKRIVNSLIQTLDFYAQDKIVIVATNLVESLDPAILRRFSYRILLDNLNKEERGEFFQYLFKNNKKITFKLKPSELHFLQELLTVLDLKTIDQIQQLVEKAEVFSLARSQKMVTLNSFIETLVMSDYINKENIKDIYSKNKNILKITAKVMEDQGFSMTYISQLLGIHRNSYSKYAK